MYRSKSKSNADAHMITTYVLIYSEIFNIRTVRYHISQIWYCLHWEWQGQIQKTSKSSVWMGRRYGNGESVNIRKAK